MVDDGDVAGPQPLGEVLGARVDARRTAHPGSPGRGLLAGGEGGMDICHPSCHGRRLTAASARHAGRERASQRRPSRRREPARACRAELRPSSAPARAAASTSTARPLRGDVAVVGLAHHQVPVGERRDLRQVGDDDHLGVPARAASRAPTSRAARPPTRVDLVEDEGRHRGGSRRAGDDLEGEHHPGQLTARGGLGHASGRARPGWRRAGSRRRRRRAGRSGRVPPPGHGSPPSAGWTATETSTTAVPIARWASSSVTPPWPGLPQRRRARALTVAAASPSSAPQGRPAARSSSASVSSASSELVEPGGGLAAPGQHLVDARRRTCASGRRASARRCCTQASRAGSTSTSAR